MKDSTLSTKSLGMIHGREQQIVQWRRAAELTPRGVHSDYRYWGVDETPMVARGKGSHLWDVDGNEFIDYRSGFGAIILGHGFDPVCDAVSDAIRNGTVFTLSTPWETRVAERMVRMCPAVEMVRFCNSGTEANMHAIRLARAYTGRERILKFEGNFHGVNDYLLWSTAGAAVGGLGARRDPIPFQTSSGIPRAIRNLILTLPVDDDELLEKTFKSYGHELAALIVEPILGNLGGITPRKQWFDLIQKLCSEYGVVFILDEVKTGFRIAPGGAQELYGIRPDLACYAKSLGNGFPVAAFGGRRDIMDLIGPGSIVHGGTFNGNVVAMSAADKVLELLEDGAILREVARQGRRLSSGFSEILTRRDVPHLITGPDQMWGLHFTDKPIHDFRSFFSSDTKLYIRIMHEMLKRGVFPEPEPREPWFMNYGHTDAEIDYSLECFERVIKSLPDSVLLPAKAADEIPNI